MMYDYKRDIKGLLCMTMGYKLVDIYDYKRDLEGLWCMTIKEI